MFSGCTSLKEINEIPVLVKYMRCAFEGCVSLEKIGRIPRSARSIDGIFNNCTSLTGTVVIEGRSGEAYYEDFFEGVDFEKQNLEVIYINN